MNGWFGIALRSRVTSNKRMYVRACVCACMRLCATHDEQILQTYTISKTRLQQNWWKNRLKKMDFLVREVNRCGGAVLCNVMQTSYADCHTSGLVPSFSTCASTHTHTQAMDIEKMEKWAAGEPWNADVSERYYYTMSRMMDQQVSTDVYSTRWRPRIHRHNALSR